TWTVRDGAVVGQDGVPRTISAPLRFPQRDTLRRPSLPPDQASTPALRSQLAALGTARAGALPGQGEREIAFELSRRVADPFTPLAFVLAAGVLGLLLRNRAWGAASVIIFIFAFYVVLSTAPELARAGALSPLSAAWLPNGLFFAFALALAWRLR
ncbi:MAG: LptF/LptG family permease, partial [Deinococcus sp.]